MITETFIQLFSNVKLNTSVYDDLKTGHDLLSWLQSEHFHKKEDPKSGKTLTTPHEESLYEHLMECARHASRYAAGHIEGNPNIWKYFLVGFLHDIGKPGCTVSRGKHLYMKGHGPVGSAIVENITSQDLLDTFNITKTDMADIVTAINYHMCGYHARFPLDTGSLNIDAFSLLTPEVKDLICALRVGDSLAIQSNVHNQTEKNLVMSTQHQFKEAISEPVSHSTFMTSHDTTKGVLIMIQGSSGQGKTTMSHNIRQHLLRKGVRVTIFNRDTYMVNITRRYMNKDPVAQEDITGAIYREALTYYVSCDKKWAREINTKVRKGVEYELLHGNVVILDTLATMYMHHCDLIPEIARHALRIAIWVHRATAFTTDETMNRLGCTLEEQININKTRPQDFTNPIGKGLDWSNLVSITEDQDKDAYKDKNAYKRPHFTMTTGWSELMDDQFDHLMDIVSGNHRAQNIIARPPSIDDTMNASLLDLVRHLYSRGGIKLLKEFFEYNHYIIKVEEFEDAVLRYVIVIKYIDGINQFWKPRWAREARGRGYAISREGDVYEVKSSLIRGAELLTKTHLEEGVDDTQDIHDWKFDTLDVHQQTIVKMFNTKDDVPLKDAYITQKVDGSLLVVTYYPTDTSEHDLMSRYVGLTGCYHMKTDKGLYIPSTSGNVFMSDAMKCYFLTAAASFCEIEITRAFSDAIWEDIKDEFAQKMESIVGVVDQCSLVFEMVCKDRVTHNKKVHTELAISYPSSGLFFLGTCTRGTYVPHYKQVVNISQPAWRKVASTGETIQIMKDLDAAIKGKISVKDLNLKWFNTDSSLIHPEGFVYMDHYVCDDTPTYSKIKLPIYYKCHKFDRYPLSELLAFSETVDGYFPILGRVRWYTTNISDIITAHTNGLQNIVEAELTITSNSYKKAPAKAKKRFDIYFENEKQQDKAILCKMITNGIDKEAQTRQLIVDMTRSTFNIQNDTKDDELVKISKILLMRLTPWEPGYEKRLNELVKDQKNQLMDQIYRTIMYN
jgi:hypothetical protein